MFKEHISILVQEVCAHIPHNASMIIDGTAGHGGHVRAMGEYQQSRSGHDVIVVGVDKDTTMIDRLSKQQEQ
jgi:16S rRNA C1402 N4-methylase RsmH